MVAKIIERKVKESEIECFVILLFYLNKFFRLIFFNSIDSNERNYTKRKLLSKPSIHDQ